MLPTFLILLVSAIGSIWLSLRASHEVPRVLAVGSAIFCLIFGFALAPWPIQVLIGLFLLSLERLYPYRRTALEFVTLSSNSKRRR